MTINLLTTQELYVLSGVFLFTIGLWGTWLHAHYVRKIISLNVMGAGVFLILIALAYRGKDLLPDPLPHALVLTGIVVAVSATALALVIIRRLEDERDE
ncbi:MAG: cation:proton antiporter subunit C [Thiolinea sp.]